MSPRRPSLGGVHHHPGDGSGGSALASQPVVVIRDAGGNVAAGAVTLSLGPGLRHSRRSPDVQRRHDRGVVAGAATFSGCRVDKAGAGYRLLATIDGAGITRLSASFDAGLATRPTWCSRRNLEAAPAAPWATQPAVAVLDAGGNLVTASAAEIEPLLSPAGRA